MRLDVRDIGYLDPGYIFSGFGTPVALGAVKGPEDLAYCLLDAQAPPWFPNNLITRLKYYALQLSDPNPDPNHDHGWG